MDDNGELYCPEFDLGEFRYSAARYVKLLIRSRWKCDPGFLGQEDLASWGLKNIGRDKQPAWKLINQAARTLGHLNLHFLPRCGSGGVQETDESTPEGRLIFAISFLADIEGGGPCHNGALLEAALQLRNGKAVDWNELVDWSLLPAIRADLSQLPHPARESAHNRFERIETMLGSLNEKEKIKNWYSIEEVARLVDRSEYTCREWCRLGRIRASKKNSGRGKYQSWAVSHEELLRYQKEGLLPEARSTTQRKQTLRHQTPL